jgi:protein mago nashi
MSSEGHDDFYVRYYAGHRGQFGHEFMEFELYPSGKLRYANNSNYHKDDNLIRKEVFVSPAVVEEFKRIVQTSDITHVDDQHWKEPDGTSGCQELECRIGSHHLSFNTCEIGSQVDIQKSSDPNGLQIFFLLVQDLKALVMALISIHFKSRPIPGRG